MDLDLFKRWMGLRTLYLKTVLPLPFPQILNIEPTNRCNLLCTMCPRHTSRRPVTDMDWTLFETLCRELARKGPILKIFLQKDGEPLLHPRIVDMVRRLNEVKAAKSVGIITNGTLLTEELFTRLANAGLHDLIVSIDAIEAGPYRELKGVDRFEQVVQNVRNAAKIKKARGWKFPLIKARMVSRKGFEGDLETFKKSWVNTVDMVDITPYHTWIGAVRDERSYGGSGRYPCPLLWYTGVINADGIVSPCCIDYNQDGALGKVGSDGFAPIWNGRQLHRLRKLHLLEEYDRTEICGPCEYWLIKENIGAWLKRKYRI